MVLHLRDTILLALHVSDSAAQKTRSSGEHRSLIRWRWLVVGRWHRHELLFDDTDSQMVRRK